MKDYLVRATAAGAQIRAFAATTRELTEYARSAHNTSPVMTAALGRLMTGAVMMGAMMKNDTDTITLQVRGVGPGKGITATAKGNGEVNGYCMVPDVMLPPNALGKLDVGGAFGTGFLRVIKDMGLKEPYIGTSELQTGEIAEDLTYYFATSEQIPSSVGLGVLMNKDNTVKQAGGFIIQVMPFISDEVLEALEEKLKTIDSVTAILDSGKSPEEMLEILLGDLDLEITDKMDVAFTCNCDKERVEKALISLGRKEIKDMISEGKDIEIKCQICNKAYYFSPDDLKKIISKCI
ncbi:MAG: Hsp33 family molecular chaperone HslO [Lachnospiraceae bacterium]|nr:Hsp33 family molecular chaperone HslO [Lachnospiraceae bacterium]